MARGVSNHDEARLQGVLLTPTRLAQRLGSKLWFWHSADFLTVDSDGLVAGALDLTGQGRTANQPTAANRLTYFPSDPMFGGRPSFGSTTNLGQRCLPTFATYTVFQYFFSCYYKDGVAASFDFVAHALSGINSFGTFMVRGEAPSAQWRLLLSTRTFYNTGDPYPRKNGYDPNQTALPMPASVIESRAGLGRTNHTHIGGSAVLSLETTDRVWQGGFRNFLACKQVLSDQETALVEGVIAWDDGIQGNLNPAHPFANRPPLIGD